MRGAKVAEMKPFSTAADEGTALWHMGSLMVFKATGEQTDGQYWLAEQVCNSGYASPIHQHTREDELFHVLDGELSVEIDGTMHWLAAGGTVFAPRGLAHSYKVESAKARFLVFGTPAGFERWFFDTGRPATELTVPEFDPASFPDFGEVIASLEAYGARVLGPPRA
jgi:quercetin dioxygenase-like cupin family protein